MKREEYFHLFKVKFLFDPTVAEMMRRFCVLAFCAANYDNIKTKHPFLMVDNIEKD